jgi:hypothetical protein
VTTFAYRFLVISALGLLTPQSESEKRGSRNKKSRWIKFFVDITSDVPQKYLKEANVLGGHMLNFVDIHMIYCIYACIFFNKTRV